MTAAERKAQIITVVLNLVDKRGVQGTTTARIAAAAGVTEPTLYKDGPADRGAGTIGAASVVGATGCGRW